MAIAGSISSGGVNESDSIAYNHSPGGSQDDKNEAARFDKEMEELLAVVKWVYCMSSSERNGNGSKPNTECLHLTNSAAEFGQVMSMLFSVMVQYTYDDSNAIFLLVPRIENIDQKIIKITGFKPKMMHSINLWQNH